MREPAGSRLRRDTTLSCFVCDVRAVKFTLTIKSVAHTRRSERARSRATALFLFLPIRDGADDLFVANLLQNPHG